MPPATLTKSSNGTGRRRAPGEDRPVSAGGPSVIEAVRQCKREADEARRGRLRQNKVNVDMYLGRQDWSHKAKGQSRQVLPKVAMAVEQHAAFVQKGLTDSGRWFSIDLPPDSQLEAYACEKLLKQKLETLNRDDSHRLNFATLIADGLKVALLQSLLILKVSGFYRKSRQYTIEQDITLKRMRDPNGQMQTLRIPQEVVRPAEVSEWQLVIELIRPEDYYPDPTGRGLYEIHEVERDLSEVVAMTEGPDPIYDPKVVAQLQEDCTQDEEVLTKAQEKDQLEATPPSFRKRVVIHEFWGDLLDETGRVAHENIVCAVANDKFLIRPPEPNPFWHGQSPFVAAPLTRVPFSTWHKALMDNPVALNISENELFSLMVDGSMATVWGTRQLRTEQLEDPKQVADGIPQGITLMVKDTLPAGAKVLETVTTGQVPQDAMNMAMYLDREFQEAAKTSSTKQGVLPARTTKATEIVATERAADVFSDSLIRNLEDNVIENVLWKAWCNMLQHADDLDSMEVIEAIGMRGAYALSQMTPAQRFQAYAGCRFRVNGLSAVAARQQDFAKQMALMQAAGTNPLLMQAFTRRFSTDKYMVQMVRNLNIDPEMLQLDPQEQQEQAIQAKLQEVGRMQQLTAGPNKAQSLPADQMGGDAGVPAAINQAINPMSGLTPNA